MGKRKRLPDLPTLQALAKLYGVKVDDLVGVEEYEQAKKTKSIRVSPLFAIVLVFLSFHGCPRCLRERLFARLVSQYLF
jgi:hypothetical protein